MPTRTRARSSRTAARATTRPRFQKGTFDHATTKFPLVDKHAGLACADCHKGVPAGAATPPRPASATRGAPPPDDASPPRARGRDRAAAARTVADFRGLKINCDSCHTDVHRAELGTACETCHTATHVRGDAVHPREAAPVLRGPARAGEVRASATRRRCSRSGPARRSRPCASASRRTATTCVVVSQGRAPGSGAADLRELPRDRDRGLRRRRLLARATKYPLTGKHAPLACEACHKVETARVPGRHRHRAPADRHRHRRARRAIRTRTPGR